MERRIGEKFTVDGKTYVVKEGKYCADCVFRWEESSCSLSDFIKDNFGYCSKRNRKDSKNVIFEEITKTNKINKMKEFNLEEAKAGKPVCTRDGRKARIICFDVNNTNYPIAALVKDVNNKEEYPYAYSEDGRFVVTSNMNAEDLMMAPEKKQGWIGLYHPNPKVEDAFVKTTDIYATKEEVEKLCLGNKNLIDIRQIEWEE